MKKLLAMLITITSLSSITPIVLANASAEMPENKIVNKEINSLCNIPQTYDKHKQFFKKGMINLK